MSVQTTLTEQDQQAGLTNADIAAIEAIMAETKVDRDQAVHAFAEVRGELQAEPTTGGVDEDEQYLRWYTRRRFLIEAEETRVSDQMAAMLKMLAAKKAGLDFLCRANAEHITKKMLAGKKVKSHKLPHGTCGFRAVPGSVEIPTEKMPEVVAWCEANLADAIRIRKEVVKTPIGDLFKLSGEKVPGVIYHEPRDKFYVS